MKTAEDARAWVDATLDRAVADLNQCKTKKKAVAVLTRFEHQLDFAFELEVVTSDERRAIYAKMESAKFLFEVESMKGSAE